MEHKCHICGRKLDQRDIDANLIMGYEPTAMYCEHCYTMSIADL